MKINMRAWSLLVILLLAALSAYAQAAPTLGRPITIPLTEQSAVEEAVGRSLLLRVEGDATEFEVAVISKKRVRGCPQNLVYWASHGPDASDVMPWHVANRYFPNTRLIPVCGRALAVEVSLIAPTLSPDGERFTSGTLVVTIKPNAKVLYDRPMRH